MAFTFSYPSSPYALATGVAVDISRVIVSGIQPANTVYTISPGLPSPLTINSINGTITGLPTFSSISPITNYTVDASYSTAVVTTTLQLGVNFLPVFSYPFSPYIKQLNTAASIVPIYLISNLQGIVYSIISSPPLTDISLNLNDVNGVITGTPNIASAETTYIIRANNAGVIYDASLNISVQTLPTISYPEGTYNLTQGVAVSIIPTEDMSQTYVSYSIEGCALPVGLSFNTATGAITGTPTVLSSYREYTITVTNVIGSASTKLILNVIKVFLAPPVFSDTTSSGMCLTEPSLAMRRKAEILQYKKNNANISRRQNFSLIAQGKGPYAKRAWGNQSDLVSNPNISGLEQQGNTIVCNSSGIICSPTSSSDVPGPVMDLCYNPNVPLVGYLQPTRTKVNIGFKWPQRSWSIGDMGFPVGKAGNTN